MPAPSTRTPAHRRRLARAVLAGSLALSAPIVLGASPALASPNTVADATAGTNGKVLAIAQTSSRIYIGGSFSWAGPDTGYGLGTSDSTGARIAGSLRVNGPVTTAIATPSGWYIAGSFTRVGNQTRNGLARISKTGQLQSWNPAPDGPVHALAYNGVDTIYVGGSFSNLGGAPRSNIGAVASTMEGNAIATWNPGANGAVTALDVSADGTLVYVGGDFSTVDGESRSRLAALDAGTGDVDFGWNPGADGNVAAIEADAGTVYVGGSFANAGGAARSFVAAIDETTGSATAFDAAADGAVRALELAAGRLFAGGAFSSIGGETRTNLASLDPITGDADLSFDPAPDGAVNSLDSNALGTRLFVGGAFTSIAGVERSRAAALDTTTGAADGWEPSADATVRAVARSGTLVFVGGDFTMLNGRPRDNVAAIDATTGEVDPRFRSDTNNEVRGLAASADGTRLFVGGIFTQLGGVGRQRIAAVDAATGAVDAGWNPGATGPVRPIVVGGSRVFVGGSYTEIGGENIARLAALDATTGAVDTSFTPAPDGTIRAMDITSDGSRLWVGGFYGSIGGAGRDGLAILDATTGNATSFNPTSVGSDVMSVTIGPLDERFYFSTKGNKTGAYVLAPGNVAPVWDMKSSGDVQAMAASENELYVGGHFTKLNQGGGPRNKIGSLDADTGANTAWNPKMNSFWGVWAMDITPTSVLAGGEFTRVSGKIQQYFASFSGGSL